MPASAGSYAGLETEHKSNSTPEAWTYSQTWGPHRVTACAGANCAAEHDAEHREPIRVQQQQVRVDAALSLHVRLIYTAQLLPDRADGTFRAQPAASTKITCVWLCSVSTRGLASTLNQTAGLLAVPPAAASAQTALLQTSVSARHHLSCHADFGSGNPIMSAFEVPGPEVQDAVSWCSGATTQYGG